MPTMSTFTTILAALTIASAAPSFPSFPTCGIYTANPDKCANTTLAQQSDYAYYQSTPGIFTFAECHSSCLKTPECKSFSYDYVVNSGFGYSQCYEYALPVSDYTTNDCSPAGSQPLNTFYDKYCPPLFPETQGQSPSTCVDSYCYPLGTLKEPDFYRDQLASAFNVTNAQCKQMCREHPLCKSVFWQYFYTGAEKPFNQTQQTGLPDNTQDCMLLSQPVQDLIEPDGLQSVPLYDPMCPDTEYGYIIKAPICPNGKSAHSSV